MRKKRRINYLKFQYRKECRASSCRRHLGSSCSSRFPPQTWRPVAFFEVTVVAHRADAFVSPAGVACEPVALAARWLCVALRRSWSRTCNWRQLGLKISRYRHPCFPRRYSSELRPALVAWEMSDAPSLARRGVRFSIRTGVGVLWANWRQIIAPKTTSLTVKNSMKSETIENYRIVCAHFLSRWRLKREEETATKLLDIAPVAWDVLCQSAKPSLFSNQI